MKRMLLLTVATVLVGLLLGSVALAQQTTQMTAATVAETTPGPLTPSGGMSLVLPAAALLVGTGVLTYVVLRRRM